MDRPDTDPLTGPWGTHRITESDPLDLSVGPLRLRARIESDEIRLVHASGDWARPAAGEDGGGDGGRPRGTPDERLEEAEWVRWPLPTGIDAITVIPVFPDRPLVVAPESSFRLLPGAAARIYVRVPLWAAVELGGGGGRLAELPTVVLSETWWGTFTEGELCYWLPTSARRRVGPEALSVHQAVCPLSLTNRAEEELRVEKIALRVGHLSVFGVGGGFWSDETSVRYRGEDAESEIRVGGQAPREAPEAERVSAPRTPPLSRAITARTFARLRALSGLGGD